MNRVLLAWFLMVGMMLNSACTNVVFEGTGNRVRMTPEQILATGKDIAGVIVWGGRVLSVNQGADWTDLEVLAFPLDGANSPRTDKMPIGRFVASYPSELEPLQVIPGHVITLAGELQGFRQGQVGEAVYQFPAVVTTRVHLWSR